MSIAAKAFEFNIYKNKFSGIENTFSTAKVKVKRTDYAGKADSNVLIHRAVGVFDIRITWI